MPLTSVPFEAQRLISRMLSVDPNKRPTAAEVSNDQFVMQSDGQMAMIYSQLKN